jgi:hypothetical protein
MPPCGHFSWEFLETALLVLILSDLTSTSISHPYLLYFSSFSSHIQGKGSSHVQRERGKGKELSQTMSDLLVQGQPRQK